MASRTAASVSSMSPRWPVEADDAHDGRGSVTVRTQTVPVQGWVSWGRLVLGLERREGRPGRRDLDAHPRAAAAQVMDFWFSPQAFTRTPQGGTLHLRVKSYLKAFPKQLQSSLTLFLSVSGTFCLSSKPPQHTLLGMGSVASWCARPQADTVSEFLQ